MEHVIGFIGAGNMGGALLGGLAREGLQNKVLAFDISGQALTNAVSLGAEAVSSAAEVAMKADIIVLAVKPQFYPEVLPQIQGNLRETAMVISLAPGYDIAALKKALGQEQRIVRAMPNTPALLGEGMTSVAFSEDSYEDEEKEAVLQIFRKAGKAVEIREALMDAAMAAASCSPAFAYLFIEALGAAATAMGVPRALSYEMAAQSLLGAAKMVLETGKHPGELKDMVCSPGGTTIQGVIALEKAGFRAAVMEAAKATLDRAQEMKQS